MEELNIQFVPETDKYSGLSLDEQENLNLLELIGEVGSGNMELDEECFDILSDK